LILTLCTFVFQSLSIPKGLYFPILRYAMHKLRHLDTVYLYFLHKLKNPRITVTDFFTYQSAYESDNSLRWLINDAFREKVISQPEIFCNVGVSVDLLSTVDNQLKLLKKCRNDPKTTYAAALCGAWSFLRVRKGASDLKFANRVVPSLPGITTSHKIKFSEKGKLKDDLYPHGWDEIDWEVYYIMKNPSISFTEAIRISKKEGTGLSRKTIKKHFKKILEDCKIQMNFFPWGYGHYDKILFTFKTKYEIGLYDSLKKLDRTSYLWKVRDFIILTLFVEHYCKTVRSFKELEENGLIQNLKVSIPNRHYSPFEEDFI